MWDIPRASHHSRTELVAVVEVRGEWGEKEFSGNWNTLSYVTVLTMYPPPKDEMIDATQM
jgi:hypothetical protein